MPQSYFDWFDLEPRLIIDEGVLKKLYYAKSKAVHPDFHTLSDDSAQESMLHQASYNNAAYKTLKDFDLRLKYILDLYGHLPEEGNASVPQEFLMEMMDFNERIMELEMDFDAGEAKEVQNALNNLDESMLEEVTDFVHSSNLNLLTQPQWDLLRDFYLKKRYLWRLRQNIDRMMA